jgi:hypothetical protein
MFEYKTRQEEADEEDGRRIPTDTEMRDEVNRVAATLIRLMEVSA